MELFKTVPAYFMAIYLFLQLLRFRYNSIKPIEKLSILHTIDYFDGSKVLGVKLFHREIDFINII